MRLESMFIEILVQISVSSRTDVVYKERKIVKNREITIKKNAPFSGTSHQSQKPEKYRGWCDQVWSPFVQLKVIQDD